MLQPNDRILFQGDSITDAGRDRDPAVQDKPNHDHAMGRGYAAYAAATLLDRFAGQGLTIHNRGVSGNKVHQLAERWDEDCLSLKPTVLSLLIGVNDFWHTKRHGYAGTVDDYERDYDALLARTRAALPGVRLILGEPFMLIAGDVTAEWVQELGPYRAVAKRLADRHGARWVAYQSVLDQAAEQGGPADWAGDGVHPTLAGHMRMAKAWLDAVTD